MIDRLEKAYKGFSKEGAVIGAVVGVLGSLVMVWLKAVYSYDLLTRILIVAIIGAIAGIFVHLLLRIYREW